MEPQLVSSIQLASLHYSTVLAAPVIMKIIKYAEVTSFFFCYLNYALVTIIITCTCNIVTSLVPRPRRGPGREKSGLVSNVCACAEITKKTGNRILSVNSSYYGTV